MLQSSNRRSSLLQIRVYHYCLLCALLVALLSGCTVEERARAQRAPTVPTAVIASNLTTCRTAGVSVSAAQPDALDELQPEVRYDAEARLITIPNGADLTLPQLSQSISDAGVIQELAAGEWLLGASIRIQKGGTLRIGGPAVNRLRLRSDRDGFVFIKALGGTLEITDTCVTSWDNERRDVDTNHKDGRSFILARDGGRLTVRDSELSYLGYAKDESYGVALRLAGTRGEIVNSKLGYNYYGLYLYQASDILITGNEVHHSILYGIDPHTNSNRLRIEGNRSHHNGKHGIILANGCNDSVIINNEVYANAIHGIVLYQGSNNNIVKDNKVYNNKEEGINLNGSSNNAIHSNTAYGNTTAGIGIGQGSRDNQIQGNIVHTNPGDGISLYSNASGNAMEANSVYANQRYGIYIKSAHNTIGNNNKVYDNQIGVYVNAEPTPAFSRTTNQIYNNRDDDVRHDE